jgi:hypothetical protein
MQVRLALCVTLLAVACGPESERQMSSQREDSDRNAAKKPPPPAPPPPQACKDGTANCDGDPRNQCETDLRTSLAHCGSCGNTCAVENGTASCSGGSCTAVSCNEGFELANGACIASGPCRIVNGVRWCYDPNAPSIGCTAFCASLGLPLTIDDTTWSQAQDTAAECRAIADALGLEVESALANFHTYACIELAEWIDDSGRLPTFMCSNDPACPSRHRTASDVALPTAPWVYRPVCPCQ